ncbi:MAG: hypothetical protein NTU91_12965 [Chloroflexi bacterium]|nr:hypothetical protein [Chloroflexota bacterium]
MLQVLDRNTGKTDPGKHRKQLVGHATWASIHFGIKPERVRPTLACAPGASRPPRPHA